MASKKPSLTTKKASAPAPTKPRALNARVLRFVEEYLVDLNGTQAAIRAGYSKKTANEQASRLLANVNVSDAVLAAMKKRSERTEITQDMVLRELAKLGFSDIRKVVTWGNTELRVSPGNGDEDQGEVVEAYHGLVLKAADEIDDDTAAAIAEVSQGREGLKVKLYDKRASLVDIGKHLGMFIERKEIRTGPLDGVSDQDLARKAAEAAQQVAELEGLPVDAVLAQINSATATPTVH